ncbi:protein of unknown function [Pararobbsia alpina]
MEGADLRNLGTHGPRVRSADVRDLRLSGQARRSRPGSRSRRTRGRSAIPRKRVEYACASFRRAVRRGRVSRAGSVAGLSCVASARPSQRSETPLAPLANNFTLHASGAAQAAPSHGILAIPDASSTDVRSIAPPVYPSDGMLLRDAS